MKLKSFDPVPFMENFKGMEDIAHDMILEFLCTLPTMLSNLKDAVNARDPSRIELAAHTIKGVVSTFYAEPSRRLAEKLEAKGKERQLENVSEIFRELSLELTTLSGALRAITDAEKIS